jgi:hypothetical protein
MLIMVRRYSENADHPVVDEHSQHHWDGSYD